MEYFPAFIRLEGRPCLVVGGGTVAYRKVRQLLAAGARVTVNAPRLPPELAALREAGRITHVRGGFEPGLVERHLLVIAATDDVEVNTRVYQAACRADRLINTVDDARRSSFISPAVVDRAPVLVAISTGGASPVLARRLREQVERLLPAKLGRLARLTRQWRRRVRNRLGSTDMRRRFWEQVLDGEVADLVYAGQDGRAERALERMLGGAGSSPRGRVDLVGAGPGDPGLLTLRALQVMQRADVVLHDRLAAKPILELARRDAERICVGKRPGGRGMRQEAIDALMIRLAREGKRVCRLKGGDPMIFGRGGEELEALVEAGVDCAVVPGITAASGCAASAGVPLTHRALATGVALVTAQVRDGAEAPDWVRLARADQTLAIYMGVGRADWIRSQLLAHGRDPATPIALVENGTTPSQRVLTGSLGELPVLVERERVEAPAMLYVGATAALAVSLGRAVSPEGDPSAAPVWAEAEPRASRSGLAGERSAGDVARPSAVSGRSEPANPSARAVHPVLSHQSTGGRAVPGPLRGNKS